MVGGKNWGNLAKRFSKIYYIFTAKPNIDLRAWRVITNEMFYTYAAARNSHYYKSPEKESKKRPRCTHTPARKVVPRIDGMHARKKTKELHHGKMKSEKGTRKKSKCELLFFSNAKNKDTNKNTSWGVHSPNIKKCNFIFEHVFCLVCVVFVRLNL